jgi:hypothetical protein
LLRLLPNAKWGFSLHSPARTAAGSSTPHPPSALLCPASSLLPASCHALARQRQAFFSSEVHSHSITPAMHYYSGRFIVLSLFVGIFIFYFFKKLIGG